MDVVARQKKMSPFPFIHNEKGHSVVLMMLLAVTLAAVVDYGISGSLQSFFTANRSRAHIARVTLTDQLKFFASLGDTFRSSIDPTLPPGTNQALLNCIIGGSSPCVAVTPQPVTLYHPLSTGSTSSATRIIAGPSSSQPVRFDLNGNPCAQGVSASSSCPFSVYASFTAVCAAGAATCARADSLSIRYYLAVFPNTTPLAIDCDSTDMAKILPPSPDSANGNVAVKALTAPTSPTSSTLSPSEQLAAAGMTNPEVLDTIDSIAGSNPRLASEIVQALIKAHVTNPDVALPMAINNVTDSELAASVNNAITQAGVTDPVIIWGLINANVTSVTLAASVAAAIQASGVTDIGAVDALAFAQITDVSQAIARGTALASVPQGSYGWGMEEFLATTGITNPFLIQALSQSGIKDRSLALSVSQTITAAGITDLLAASAVAWAEITDVSLATKVAAAVKATGLSISNDIQSDIAWAIASANITDPVLAKQIADALLASETTDLYNVMEPAAEQHLTSLSQINALIAGLPPPTSDPDIATTDPTYSGGATSPTASTPPSNVSLINTCTGTLCSAAIY